MGGCTIERIRNAIEREYNRQLEAVDTVVPDLETLEVTEHSLVDFYDNNRSPKTKWKLNDAKGHTPVFDALREAIKAGKALFVTKNSELKTFTFIPRSLLNFTKASEMGALVDLLVANDIDADTAKGITRLYAGFKRKFKEKWVTKDKLFSNELIQLLSQQVADENGKVSTELPPQVLFSMAVQTLRWIVSDGKGTLAPFDDYTIRDLAGIPADQEIPSIIRRAFARTAGSGSPRNITAESIGRLVWQSLNIKSDIGEYSRELDKTLALQLGHMSLYLAGQLQLKGKPLVTEESVRLTDEEYRELNEQGYDYSVYHSYYAINEDALDELEGSQEMPMLRKALDKFFGTNQKFNEVSNEPIDPQTNIPGFLGKIGGVTRRVLKRLSKTPWVPNSSFAYFSIGTQENSSEQLKAKSKELRRKLAGVVDLNTVHVDQREGVAAANKQLIAQLRVISDNVANGMIDRFYVKWKVMRTSRIMIASKLDPLGSKIHRFLFKPAVQKTTTFDPKNEKLLATFKMAVAQHFGEDVDKTDVLGSTEQFNKVWSAMADPESALFRAVTAAIEIEQTPTEASELAFVEAMLELADQYPGTNTALISGVIALAQYQQALTNGTTFETDVTLEADAITSGYGLSLLTFAIPGMQTMKRELRRVGVAFAGDAKTFSERVKKENMELYPDGYLNFATELFAQIEEKLSSTGDKGAKDAFKGVLKTLKLTTENYKALRKAGKPAFMVLGYGGGSIKVTKEFLVALHSDMLTMFVEFENQYAEATTDAQRKQIAKDTLEFAKNVNILAGADVVNVNAKNVIAKLKNKGLRNTSLKYRERKILFTLRELMGDAVKNADESTNVIKPIKDAMIQAVELQYMMFMVKFEAEVLKVEGRTQDKLTETERLNIAKELLEFYPLLKLPSQTKDGEFLDLIKSTQNTVLESTRYELPVVDNTAITPVTYSFGAPGSSALTRPIQSLDANVLQYSLDQLEKDGAANSTLPIHDAIVASIADAFRIKDLYNGNYFSLGQKYDPLGQVYKRMMRSYAALTPEERALLDAKFAEEAFVNQPDSEGVETGLTTVDQAIKQVTEARKENQEGRTKLIQLLKDAVIQHMYLPDNLEDISTEEVEAKLEENLDDHKRTPRIKRIEQPDANGQMPLDLTFDDDITGSSFQDLLDKMTNWHVNVPVATSAGRIFNDLAAVDPHHDSKHEKHLEGVLHDIVLKFMDNLDGLLAKTGFVNEEKLNSAVGGFSQNLNTIYVQLNKAAPITYTNQGAQEVYVHELLHAVMDLVLNNDKYLFNELAKLHAAGMELLTVEDFLDERGALTDSAAELVKAKEMYDYVATNPKEFLIYALTNKYLVKKLTQAKSTRPNKLWEGKTFVDRLINLFNYVIDRFNHRVFAKPLSANMYDDFASFAVKVAAINAKQHKTVGSLFRNMHMVKLAEKGMDILIDVLINKTNKLGQKVAGNTQIGKLLKNLESIGKELPPQIAQAATYKAFDKAFVALSSTEQMRTIGLFFKDLVAGTGSTQVQELLLRSKKLVDAQRRNRSVTIIKLLNEATQNKNITNAQKEALTHVLIKTDMQTLITNEAFTIDEIMEMLRDQSKLDAAIKQYQNKVGTAQNTSYRIATDQLANLMMTGVSFDVEQALNASSIYQQWQELNGNPVDFVKDAHIVKNIDILVTLKAMRKIEPATLDNFMIAANEEFAGNATNNLVTKTLELHSVNVKASRAANFDDNPLLMIKGYTRTTRNMEIDVISAPLSEEAALAKDGYVLEEKLSVITGKEGWGLYVNRYNPEAPRTSGVISYTGQKSKGTTLYEILGRQDKYQKLDPTTGEGVPDPKKIKPVIDQIIKAKKASRARQIMTGSTGATNPQLIPLRDSRGKIYDYRIMMSHARQQQLLNQDMRVDTVLSQMEMHYIDKAATKKIEGMALQYLVETYDREYTGPADKRFINLLDPKYKEKYYDFLPRSLKEGIRKNARKNAQGEAEFPVKWEELHIMFGHKDYSVSQVKGWKKAPHAVRKGLLRLEDIVIKTVRLAAVNIVIKNIDVIFDNGFSNTWLLGLEGMNPVAAVTGQLKAAKALRQFKLDAQAYIKLHYEFQGGGRKDARLKQRMDLLKKNLENSPVAELMDMGLYTSIVEDIELNEYKDLDSFSARVEEVASKYMPKSLLSLGRHLYMTKETPIYKSMQEIFQMSDFIARVTLNEHLKKTRADLTREQRMQIVFDQFALYDIPGTSRVLHYMNKTGFVMFSRYWIKILRAAIKTAQRRPKSVFAFLLAQNVLDVDVPDIYDSSVINQPLPMIAGPEYIIENVLGLPLLDLVEDTTPL